MTLTHNPFSSRYIRPGAIPYLSVTGESPRGMAERFLGMPARRALIVGPHGTGKSTLLHGMFPWLGRVVEAINIPACELSFGSSWSGSISCDGSSSRASSSTASSSTASSSLAGSAREEVSGPLPARALSLGDVADAASGVAEGDSQGLACGERECGGCGELEVYWVRMQEGKRTPKGVWGWLGRVGARSLVVVDGLEQWNGWQVRWYGWRLRMRGARMLGTSHREMAGIPTLVRTRLDAEVESRVWEWLVQEVPPGEMRESMERAWRVSRERWPAQLRESLWEMYDWMEAEHG